MAIPREPENTTQKIVSCSSSRFKHNRLAVVYQNKGDKRTRFMQGWEDYEDNGAVGKINLVEKLVIQKIFSISVESEVHSVEKHSASILPRCPARHVQRSRLHSSNSLPVQMRANRLPQDQYTIHLASRS